jgi:Carboxypeptidase regulatory-like domain
MVLRSWLVASVGALAASQPLAAQRDKAPVPVRGVAYDSLRGQPLRNAFIAIVGTARSVQSDARGHFHLDSVPPGSYVFAAQHDAIDSLGLTEVATRVAVTDGRAEVRIAVPSFSTLWRVACGARRAPRDSGFVYGTVRDASSHKPVAGAFVDLTWVEILLDRQRGVMQRLRRVETRTDAAGRFSVCGVPVAQWLRIGAGARSGASGTIDVPPGDLRVYRRDLLIGPAGRTQSQRGGTIWGVVTDAAGAPVADARVVADDTTEVRTGADGSFVIRHVLAGTRQLEALAIGMRPVVTAIDVLPGDTSAVVLRLQKVTTLDVVRVTASRRGRLIAEEIESRRKSGVGHLMDVGDIARRASLSSVFRDLPSAEVRYSGGDFTVLVPDGRGGTCEPDIWVDGARSAAAALNLIQPKEVAAVELFPRAGTVPTRYQRDVGGQARCGAILVWTNWALGRP